MRPEMRKCRLPNTHSAPLGHSLGNTSHGADEWSATLGNQAVRETPWPRAGGQCEGGPMARDNAKNTGSPVGANTLMSLMRELAFPPCAIERSSVVPQDVTRRENDAEHSFTLGLAAVCLAPLIDPALDSGRIARYALVHDLPEVHAGTSRSTPTRRNVRRRPYARRRRGRSSPVTSAGRSPGWWRTCTATRRSTTRRAGSSTPSTSCSPTSTCCWPTTTRCGRPGRRTSARRSRPGGRSA
ncbi:HD domain-containing protein [Microbispora hainanensis]|uniref:HD domain-containing protein n=1 Tax=Microbispora hainanensis TaxID=568844 RepID=UPI0033F005FD